MMKRVYESPRAYAEMFTPDEYVAACITGVIQCGYPGTKKTVGNPNIFDDYKDGEGEWWIESYEPWRPHGLCGNDAPLTFNSHTFTGYEVVYGEVDRSRKIYDISGWKESNGTGTFTGITWKSQVGDDVYNHKGRLRVTNIDTNRPNHS